MTISTDPSVWLARHRNYAFEIAVAVQQCQSAQLRGGCDHKVHRTGTAVFTTSGQQALHFPGSSVGTIVDRLPTEQGAHFLNQTFPIGSGSGAVEELEFDYGTDRDEPRCRRSEPAGSLGVSADKRHQGACIDEELGGTHRR